MNTSAMQIQHHSPTATLFAWPHKAPKILLTESEAREMITSVFAAELGVGPGRLRGDTLIKEALDTSWYELAGPIMTIENYFRTLLQDEAASDRLSIDMITDKLMGRASQASLH